MSSRDKDKGSGQFVNDLLRTEFHKYVRSACSIERHLADASCIRKFMAKFIKVRVLHPYPSPHNSHDGHFSVMHVSFFASVLCIHSPACCVMGPWRSHGILLCSTLFFIRPEAPITRVQTECLKYSCPTVNNDSLSRLASTRVPEHSPCGILGRCTHSSSALCTALASVEEKGLVNALRIPRLASSRDSHPDSSKLQGYRSIKIGA